MSQQTITQTGAFTNESRDRINENFTELYQDDAGGTLASAKILVGNGSNVATAVDMSGDATIDNTGAVDIQNGITNNELVSGVAAGYAIARGSTALDGSNPTPVTTGLATVVSATVTLRGSSAPGVGTSVLTQANTNWGTGALSVYAWKVTGAGDATLIASTGTETFDWVAVGT